MKKISDKNKYLFFGFLLLLLSYLIFELDRDWFDYLAAIASIILAFIIGYFQYKQSLCLEDFEKRQDERDERRYAESVKSNAISFLSKHYEERDLIPLCAIAVMHDDIYYYTREIYRDFCCLTAESQNFILKYQKLDLRITKSENFYANCINVLNKEIKEKFPEDKTNLFYESGKYISYGIKKYGKEEIPKKTINYKPHYADHPCLSKSFDGTAAYEEYITDALSDYLMKRPNYSKTPIKDLSIGYKFKSIETTEIEACQFCMTLARYIAHYLGMDYKNDKNYGNPDEYFYSAEDNTMEDLFLLCMYEIYTNLILKRKTIEEVEKILKSR